MEKERKWIPFIITFLILFFFWIIFSGKFDLFHLTLGVISCLLVSRFTYERLINIPTTGGMLRLWLGFLLYFPWLIWQIILANVHVLGIVFSPRMMDLIDPTLITFKSRIKDPLALVTFANSITLTPGTITVSLTVYGNMVVHAIDKESAAQLPGIMEKKVAQIFGE